MSVRSAQSVTILFTTRVFATGVGTNADSLPAGTLYLNGVSNAATVTVANLATGVYTAQVTLPTLALGDLVDLRITATVDTVPDSAIIWRDTKDLALDSSYRPGIDWSNVGAPTTTLGLTGTTIAITQKVDVDTIKTNPVANGGTVTFPTNATLASTTNITAGTIATVTTVTTLTTYTGNTPQSGDAYAIVNNVSYGNSALMQLVNAIDDYVDTEMATIVTQTGAAAIRSAIGLNTANLDTQIGALPTLAEFFTVDSTKTYADAIAGSIVAEIADNAAGGGGGGLDAAGVRAAVGLATANLDTQLGGINAKTTNLPSDPADASDISTSFATLAGYIDTEVATIVTQTGAAAIRSAVGLASASLDTQLGALPTLPEFFTVDAGEIYADAVAGSVVAEIADNASGGGGGGEVTLDLTQAVPTTNTANTLGDCLNAARAQAFGNWVLNGTNIEIYAPNGVTLLHTFAIDSVLAPTSRITV